MTSWIEEKEVHRGASLFNSCKVYVFQFSLSFYLFFYYFSVWCFIEWYYITQQMKSNPKLWSLKVVMVSRSELFLKNRVRLRFFYGKDCICFFSRDLIRVVFRWSNPDPAFLKVGSRSGFFLKVPDPGCLSRIGSGFGSIPPGSTTLIKIMSTFSV